MPASLVKRVEPFGNNHEFLEINRRIRMCPAINHVGHGEPATLWHWGRPGI